MHPHRAEAGTTLPTHAEHLLLNFAVEEVGYGTLTAALGLVYADAVLVLGDVFGVAGNPPSWVIAGATLAVAALPVWPN